MMIVNTSIHDQKYKTEGIKNLNVNVLIIDRLSCRLCVFLGVYQENDQLQQLNIIFIGSKLFV